MRAEAAFWQALEASSGDEALRLALADWLEERSDERAVGARARHLQVGEHEGRGPCPRPDRGAGQGGERPLGRWPGPSSGSAPRRWRPSWTRRLMPTTGST